MSPSGEVIVSNFFSSSSPFGLSQVTADPSVVGLFWVDAVDI